MLVYWKSLFAAPLSLLVVALLATGVSALDDDESKEETKPDVFEVEIEEGPIRGGFDGGFGGLEIPEEFKKMMEAAQEMQKLQKKYQKSVTALIEAAKKLEDSDSLMVEIPKVAKLAKEAEAIKKEMKEMQEKSGGRGIGGPFEGGIRIFGGGGGGGVLPIFPDGGFGLPEKHEDEDE